MAIVSRLKTDLQKRLENPDDGIGDEVPESLKTLVLQGAIKVPIRSPLRACFVRARCVRARCVCVCARVLFL
eukprot:2508165-Rhodomonas_salina.1